VRADRRALRKVMSNLLSNAIKFTQPGGLITISAERPSAGGIALVVSDTGVGISAEDTERVFQPYVQAVNRLTRPNEGVGLGLALARTLMRLHDGDVDLASTPGKRTRAAMHIPQSRMISSHAIAESSAG